MLAMYGAKRKLFQQDRVRSTLRHIYVELFIVQVPAVSNTTLLSFDAFKLPVAGDGDTSMMLRSSNEACLCAFAPSHDLKQHRVLGARRG